MSDTTSAVPANLASFTEAGQRLRSSLDASQASLTGLQKQVQAASPDYGVAGSTLPSVAETLQHMAEDEAFVSTIHNTLVAADRNAAGPVTISNVSVAAALAAAGNLGAVPPVVTVGATQLYGKPPTSGFVDDPICAANGNFVHDDIDLAFPGWAAVLDVVRVYNSLAVGTVGAFGPGWSSVLDLRLEPAGDGVVWAHLADGAIVAFVSGPGENDYRVVGSRRLRLSGSPDGGWALHEGNVKAWRFDPDGTFTGGVAGAATVTVERDAGGRVVGLAEARSGRWVRYDWTGDRVTSVTSSDGRRAEHRYDTDGVLVGVARPAGALRFGVEGGLIVDVVDADDVHLVHNVYDSAGRVVEQTNEFGRTTRYSYSEQGTTLVSDTVDGPRNAFTHDSRGNLTAMVDGLGRAMRLTYDQADRVTRVVDRAGAVTTHTFDDRGNLTGRTDPDGLGQEWEWDDQDRLVAETHRNGARTIYHYDGDHRRPTRIVGPDGATITIAVDPDTDLPAAITDADGVTTKYQWDADGQIVAIVDGEGNAARLRYDAAGIMVETIDGSGVAVEHTNDHAGRLAALTIGSSTTSFGYSHAGRPTSATDPAGVGWSAVYGTHGRVSSFTDAEGSTVGYRWDLFGNLAAVVAPGGAVFEQRFDAVGRQIAVSDPDGNTTERELDAEGRPIRLVDAAGREWRRHLDVLGRTVSSIAPDGAETRWEYDSLGEVSRVIQPDGTEVATELDPYGRPVVVIDEAGARYEFAYTRGGRLAERRWPSGRVERFGYDRAGRLVWSDEDGGGRVDFTLDGAGRVLVATDADGTTACTYAETGDLVAMSGPDRRVEVERDRAGRIITQVDGAGVRSTYEWDRRGQPTAAADGAGLTTSYVYNERGQVAAATSATNEVTRYGYDELGRRTSISEPTGAELSRRLDPMGSVLSQVTASGTMLESVLDPAGRTTELVADGRSVASWRYDSLGRTVEATGDRPDATVRMGWDQTGRLAAVDGPAGALRIERDVDGRLVGWSDGLERTTVLRSGLGRVVGVDDAHVGRVVARDARSPERDAAGRIVADGRGATFRYDDAGRLVEAVDAQGARHAYAYGDDGLLTSEQGPDGEVRYERGFAGRVAAVVDEQGRRTTFDYDTAGRRTAARRADGTVTRYRWDLLDHLVAIDHVDVDGSVTTTDIAIDGLGRPYLIGEVPVLWDDVLTGLPLRVGAQRYAHLAGRTLALASTAGGSPTEVAVDDPWGTDNSGPAPHVGFHGHLAAEGLVWMGARIYDPATRELLTPDPLPAAPGRPGAASPYSYGFLDPVDFLDPLGLRPVSQQEWEATRKKEEEGHLGQAWEAIKHDPWGTLAMVGVAAVGVGLCVTGVGGPAGALILAGEASSGGMGIITGHFNPREVAITGAVSGVIGGGAAKLGVEATLGSSMVLGAIDGGASYTGTSLATGRPINPQGLFTSTALGAGGGALGHGLGVIRGRIGGANPPIDEPAPPTTPKELPAPPERLALPAAPERLALPSRSASQGPDFVAGRPGSQPPVIVSQSRMAEGFDRAGFPSRPTMSPGVEYDLPGGKVRLMEPTAYAPRRASFTNASGQPIDPLTNKPVQPPPPQGMSMKDYVRSRTHIEQTP